MAATQKEASEFSLVVDRGGRVARQLQRSELSGRGVVCRSVAGWERPVEEVPAVCVQAEELLCLGNAGGEGEEEVDGVRWGPPLGEELADMVRVRAAALAWYRSRGMQVKDATPFGADWALYRSHPSKCHAHALVLVVVKSGRVGDMVGVTCEEDMEWRDVQLLCRLAHGVQKDLIVCVADPVGVDQDTGEELWEFQENTFQWNRSLRL